MPCFAKWATFTLLLSISLSAAATEHEVAQVGKTFVSKLSEKDADKLRMDEDALKKAVITEIKLKVGDAVNFVNFDDTAHNAYADFFDLGKQDPKEKKNAVKFEKSGNFTVRCAIHPKMKLKVQVQ